MSRQGTDPDQLSAFPSGPSAIFAAGHSPRQWLVSLSLLTGLTLMMFADVLFTTAPLVLSNHATDLALAYSHWRSFGFSELRHGNLALWNPCLFSGAPFFGGGQAALLYPLNALFLFLPLHQAINWSIALHILLAGVFTYAWTVRRGLRPASCFLSAVIYMFCGANFLHVYSGYLSFLCGVVWAPLLFLAIDGLFETPSLGGSLLGMFAVAMQVLAGNPQSLFYTAVAAAVYCTCCVFKARKRGLFLLGLVALVLGGTALSAVQLFAGFQEWREMLRSSGVPFRFAAMFSFPPENFLTLLVPHLFGDVKTVSYWGRYYLWEMSLYISLTGFILAMVGGVWSDPRRRRFSLLLVLLLLVLALGAHTPLFHVLYDWVPGFNKFRGNSKFIFLASLFLALLAGLGFDELLRGRRLPRLFLAVLTVIGLLLVSAGFVAHPSGPTAPAARFWHSILNLIGSAGESYLLPGAYDNPAFVLGAARLASRSIIIAGATMLCVVCLLWRLAKWRAALGLLLMLAVIELFVFARLSLDHFNLQEAINPAIKRFLDQHPGDYRIANLDYPNAALSLRAQDVWGYEPGVVLRYAQLVAFADGLNPDQAELLTTLPNAFGLDHPLLDLLRCRFVFTIQDGPLAVYERTNYLPHVLLVQHCRVLNDRNQILSAITNAAFNPRLEVILETPPDPAPVVSPDPGSVRLTDSSTDCLTIEADLRSAAILLIPDVYATGWRARALPGSAQSLYHVQPGDWCLRAIPLTAGHHRLRLEYAPSGFRLGSWVSLMFLPVFLSLVGLSVHRLVRRGGLDPAWASLRMRPGAVSSSPELSKGEFKDQAPAASVAPVTLALAIGLFASALLAFWPNVGRDFLGYSDAYVPVVGLLLVLAWTVYELVMRWRHQVWRLSALGLILVSLFGVLVSRQLGGRGKFVGPSIQPNPATSNREAGRDSVGEALLKQGRLDEAIAHFQEMLKANPSLPDIHQNLAVALLRKGRSDDAIAHLQSAVQINPKLAGAHSSLANLLLQRGRLAEAIAHYQAAIDAQPANPFYLNNLAWVLATCPQAEIRNGARAVELAQQADRLSGGRNPSILGTLAAAYAEAGQLAQAVTTARHALELANAQTNIAELHPLQSQIELYQAGSPFRDTSQTNVTPFSQ